MTGISKSQVSRLAPAVLPVPVASMKDRELLRLAFRHPGGSRPVTGYTHIRYGCMRHITPPADARFSAAPSRLLLCRCADRPPGLSSPALSRSSVAFGPSLRDFRTLEQEAATFARALAAGAGRRAAPSCFYPVRLPPGAIRPSLRSSALRQRGSSAPASSQESTFGRASAERRRAAFRLSQHRSAPGKVVEGIGIAPPQGPDREGDPEGHRHRNIRANRKPDSENTHGPT